LEDQRAKLHETINNYNRGDERIQKASEEMDQKILEEMLKQDPVIENKYLKRVIKSKDNQIKDLKNELRLRDLVEIAAMKHEAGLSAAIAIRQILAIGMKEGIL
jgi:hypothetical protein